MRCAKGLTLVFVLWASLAFAQGNPDSVLVSDTVWVGNASGEPGTHIMIPVSGKNTIYLGGMAVPLEYHLPNGNSPVVCDSVKFNGCRTENMSWKIVNLGRDSQYHELLIALLVGGEPYFEPGTGDWAKIYYTIKSNATPCTVSIDSTFFPPSSTLAVADSLGYTYSPQYVPGRIIVLPGNGVQEASQGSSIEDFRLDVLSPTKGSLRLSYALTRAGAVNIVLYDVLGRRAQRITEGIKGTGRHEVGLNADLPAGVYFVHLKAEGKSANRKVIVIR